MADTADRAERKRLLDAQWAIVRSYQAVDEHVAAALFRDEMDRLHERAVSSFTPLEPWDGLPPKVEKAFTSGPDLVRLRRILDLVRTGDRVLEIGTGQGYMTGILLRDRLLAHYCGVDINPRLVEAVELMAEANGLDFAPHHVELRDLFDLTADFVREHDPDVVLLLEVVEHVADPAAALRTVSSVMDDDQILIFSVPLLGRIEACWGHVSLFDDRRIRRLCDQAGLRVQNVEVVQNHWVLIVASRSEIPAERLAGLVSPGATDVDPTEPDYALKRISLSPESPAVSPRVADGAADSIEITAEKVGIRVKVGSGEGGVAFDTPAAGVVRMEISFDRPDDVDAVWVEQFDRDGTSLARWESPTSELRERMITYIFRPGVRTRTFVPTGDVVAGTAATTALSVRTAGRAPVEFLVRRVASATETATLPAALRVRAATSASG